LCQIVEHTHKFSPRSPIRTAGRHRCKALVPGHNSITDLRAPLNSYRPPDFDARPRNAGGAGALVVHTATEQAWSSR
jgi:hypothetical protein